MRRALALFAACTLCAQEPSTKPDKRSVARSLLDSAAESVSSAEQQTQVFALLHIGDNYQLYDSKKAWAFLEQAFAVASSLPPDIADIRNQLQAEIVKTGADVNVTEAIGMLGRLADPGENSEPRNGAVEKIVQLLVKKSEFDRASEVLVLGSAGGDYPFQSAGQILRRLPPGDQRRILVFGRALTAYTQRSRGPFAELFSRHWRELPRPMVESAVGTAVKRILERKDEFDHGDNFVVDESDNAPAGRRVTELLDLLAVVRAADPDRAAKLLASYPELKVMADKWPRSQEPAKEKDDSTSDDDDYGVSPFSSIFDETDDMNAMTERMRAYVASSNRAEEALALVAKDRDKALSMIPSIPMPSHKIDVLAAVARSAGDKDEALVNSLLSRCTTMLADIKDPAARVAGWLGIAEVSHKSGDDKQAFEALEHALDDSAEVYKKDTNAKNPNTALREYWPSTQMHRMVVWRAANMFGSEAKPLLTRITDPDLTLLTRIQMAQALLGRPSGLHSIQVSHAH
jgi:hypothetical protein